MASKPMDTPIVDFVSRYRDSGTARLHMPGHKGCGPLGCEPLDITEIAGADALYEADGILARSERNASALFGTAATFYSTEGSSQCIRAMLYLALLHAPRTGERPVIAAARNVHKGFVLAAAMLDFDIVWLWPEDETVTLCRCTVSPAQLERTLQRLAHPPAAVYVTSPDYLGGVLDIAGLAETAHRYGVPLLVDNAHGAYRKFLPEGGHPMDLGADMCSDSAHKTLPVLTGGAYLHISSTAPADFVENGKRALAMFGSTSPSYLILQSLDWANAALSAELPGQFARCAAEVSTWKQRLVENGWRIASGEPLKLTIDAANSGWEGAELADCLRRGGVECEYADPDFVVLMISPSNRPEDLERVGKTLGRNLWSAPLRRPSLRLMPPEVVCTPREAAFFPCETVPAAQAVGRVLAEPSVGCPPAVPVVVSGERIAEDAARVFVYYGIETVRVLSNS